MSPQNPLNPTIESKTLTSFDSNSGYLRVAVIGSTGYAGAELVRLLAQHPRVQIVALTSTSYAGKLYRDVYPSFGPLFTHQCVEENWEQLVEQADVIFCALPHGHVAQKLRPEWLEKVRVIDLGADFRLKDAAAFEQWYAQAHPQPELLTQAVYGLTELNREEISSARLIANPGCYPTASTLALAPLLKRGFIDPASIIIDAKSGVSGAGRALALGQHYGEANESIKAYGLGKHRHTPEIEQALGAFSLQASPTITFTPHLTPMNRGILATAYATLSGSVPKEAEQATEAIESAFHETYADELFVNVLPVGIYPETRWVKGSNRCDIGFCVDTRTRRIIVVSAIDNLVKGAAGQAIQNMNSMQGWTEDCGLEQLPLFI